MCADSDQTHTIVEAVRAAYANNTSLRIQANNTKSFLGESTDAHEILDMRAHRGIIQYQPAELVVTVRAGTPLAELQATLAEQQQMLAFEPPHFGANASIGGTVAAGLSGPARPYTGAARDFILGSRIVNGRGEALRLGGDVMKNVAGYDVSRLMAGAFGTLGVLLDVSLKVLPAPRAQLTLMHEHTAAGAIEQFNAWAGRPWPITGAYWEAGRSYLRLSGARAAVDAARKVLGGETLDDDIALWRGIREHEREFFQDGHPLWRIAVAPATPPLPFEQDTDMQHAIGWGGAQRWLATYAPADHIRSVTSAAGGHASVYRGDTSPCFQPLPAPLMALQHNVKRALDPAGTLNPGRLYPGL